MATSPLYSWPEPDNTDLVKNGALAIRTLGNAIDTTMGTMTPKSIVDAKGDLIAATANDTPARLAVGANDTMLIADSTAATGLAWKTATTQFPWQDWTPSYGGITVGNGTVQARFQRIGKLVNFYWRFDLGSTSSVGADPSLSMPSTKYSTGYAWHDAVLQDSSSGTFSKGFAINTGATTYIYAINTASTYAASAPASSTVPFTWGVTDVMFVYGSYEEI